MVSDNYCECGCGEKTALARKTISAKDVRKGQPLRFVAGHQNRVNGRGIRKPQRWRAEPGPLATPCRIWLLVRGRDGYGQEGDGNGRVRLAHVLAWERENGPIPAGCELHHLCSNRACVAPDHLILTTHAEHMAAHRTVDRDEVRQARAAGERRKETLRRLGIFDVVLSPGPQRGGRLMPEPTEVTLGEHTIPVYAQRHAYLINRLGRFMREIQASAGDLDADALSGYAQARSYELLCVMLPNLEKRVPEYEFRGYASREAMDAGEYEEQADRSPTLPEIREALSVASRVNGFDVFLHLRALVDPQLVRSWLSAQVAGVILENSPSLPSANGGSDSTSSTTSPPTSPANAA